MAPNRDIYSSADLLIERYGNEGALEHYHQRMLNMVAPIFYYL